MIATFSTHWHYIWLVVASFLAGVMNAMAGGGSFISFPAMLSIGVAPIQANATNTVALWPGQLTSVAALRGDLRRDLLPVVCAASVIGGVSGALILLKTRQLTSYRPMAAARRFPAFRDQRAGVAMASSALGGTTCSESARHCASVPCLAAGVFLYRLLWSGGRLSHHERVGAVRCGGDACAELAEGACGLSVQFLRRRHVCVQWGRDLALLPDFNGVCCSGWICGRSVCTANECKCLADNRRDYRMHSGCLLFLEEWLMGEQGVQL